ncbi:hypothetical protein RBS60_06675 [Sinomonas sp. ASV486]|uniref:aggregation-promoting factor C-terminal-like domain-containing protein n=1 Tax=Sinomonas sp. ASV486 TaxID=3051170 RepID=UPI0027DC8C50|nr:hypothetical protein [Sinomonas sp. ASV486]MDQ4489880.1 hypothetical protein [Sinomonas sp. ASV486]
MSKSPARAAARPHGRRRAIAPATSALARAASKSGIKPGSDRFGHRSAVVALSLGLLAVAGGGAAATANATDLARTSTTTPTASASATAEGPSEQSVLAQAAAEARTAAEDKAAADKAAADQAAGAKAAADKAAADKAAADAAAQAAPPQAVTDPAGAQAYAASRLAAYGWGQDQMSALITLWNKESGWSTTATNASSGAYGIVQSLPGSKMASAGADWQTNYKTQIEWGLNYIKERYGSPANALGWHLAHNWY